MKKSITIILLANLILSCTDTSKINLELENKLLQMKIDSLEQLISTSFSPIVINNNYKPDFGEGDSINFVVGLMWNKSELIDSIELNLYNGQNEKISLSQYAVRKNVSNGFTYFSLSKLNAGRYVYDGNLYFRNEQFPLYYEFEIGK